MILNQFSQTLCRFDHVAVDPVALCLPRFGLHPSLPPGTGKNLQILVSRSAHVNKVIPKFTSRLKT
jgi:hypothetical protein